MLTLSLRRLAWLLALPAGLLTGCHSAKPSFAFRPAASQLVATAAPAAPVPCPPAPLAPVAAAASAPAPPVRLPKPHPLRVAAEQPQPTSARLEPLRRALRPRAVARHQVRHRPAHSRSESGRNTFHLVLGGLLIVSSVLVGLWLGGWLGLGVGVAIMLLGDYFLVLGIGGRHAWLEIFQEFFNM
jgi:hypothetical protein